MLPLLLAGFGGVLARDSMAEAAEEKRAARIRGIMGEPMQPLEVLPEGIEGPVQYAGGSGLLADPFNPQKQAMAAARLMEYPETRQAGLSLLTGSINNVQRGAEFQQQEARAGYQFQTEQERLAEQFKAQHEQRVAQFQQEFGLRKEEAERLAKYQEARLGIERARFEFERSKGAGGAGGEGVGKPQAGYSRYAVPGGGFMDLPTPGTKEYRDASRGVQTMAEAQNATRELRDYVREYGTFDVMGGRVPGAAAQVKREKVITAIAELKNLGVLQEGEAKRLESLVPQIGGTAGSLFTTNESANASLSALGEWLDSNIQSRLEQMPNLPRKEVLPPNWITEAEYRRRISGAGRREQDAGGRK